ncbi:MAG: ABC transporter ATP-binding protein [Candidatus Cloacimonetes bacterium]|nr:ABC transporter ATP-binding protein [Candidatus Cloacimonadota bacterium]
MKSNILFSKFHWQWISNIWKRHLPFALLLVFLTILSTVSSLLFPLFFKYLINELQKNATSLQLDEFRLQMIGLLLVMGLLQLSAASYPYFRAKMNLIIDWEVREKYFHLLLEQNQEFLSHFKTGDLITRLTDDIARFPKISWFCCSGIFRAFNSLSIVVFCIGVMTYLNWKLALCTLLPLPFALWVYTTLASKLDEGYKASQKAISETNNHLESCLSGIKILMAFNGEKREVNRFERILDDRYHAEFNITKLSGKMGLFYEFIGHFGQVIVVLVGGLMVVRGELSLGDYYAFFSYLGIIVYPMLDIPHLFVTSRQAFVCIDRLEALNQKAEDVNQEVTEKSHVMSEFEHLELRNVSFSYEEQSVLDNITFSVKKGQIVAIVGKIGSGKSTLLQLIAGTHKAGFGDVRFNGVSRKDINEKSLRKSMAFVAQEPTIFSETVEENIRFFREYTPEQIKTSAGLSQVKDEMDLLPNGFLEKLGQNGVNISGGQKQRLTIARALLGKPGLLLMDDVTAALDAENEKLFWGDLKNHLDDAAIVVVTHRMATARQAHKVIYLDEGKIKAQGTFEDLKERSQDFREMINE